MKPQTQTETELAPLLLDPQGPVVVALGGGHGQAAALEAIQCYAGEISALVAVGDDGGSSGRLSGLGIPPPGDVAGECIGVGAELRIGGVGRGCGTGLRLRARRQRVAGLGDVGIELRGFGLEGRLRLGQRLGFGFELAAFPLGASGRGAGFLERLHPLVVLRDTLAVLLYPLVQGLRCTLPAAEGQALGLHLGQLLARRSGLR